MKHALPARKDILEFEVAAAAEGLPDATWTAAGIGRHQLEVNHWALELGGHCRTGLEDNVRWDKDTSRRATPSSSGAWRSYAPVRQPVATAKQAREILHLRPAA